MNIKYSGPSTLRWICFEKNLKARIIAPTANRKMAMRNPHVMFDRYFPGKIGMLQCYVWLSTLNPTWEWRRGPIEGRFFSPKKGVFFEYPKITGEYIFVTPIKKVETTRHQTKLHITYLYTPPKKNYSWKPPKLMLPVAWFSGEAAVRFQLLGTWRIIPGLGGS